MFDIFKTNYRIVKIKTKYHVQHKRWYSKRWITIDDFSELSTAYWLLGRRADIPYDELIITTEPK